MPYDESSPEFFTVQLPSWGAPGVYAVAVQLQADDGRCGQGCHISVSPTFGQTH